MTLSNDLMELKEDKIREKYKSAEAMLSGFDHTPRIAAKRDSGTVQERSPGLGTRRRFRSTTPGLVTRSTARPEGVQLSARILESDDDALTTPLQAGILRALRRALSVAQVMSDQFAEQTGLSDLKRSNLAGTLDASQKDRFQQLLSASALISLHVFANMTDYLVTGLSAETEESEIQCGDVEEILLDNDQLALHGTLWELDQEISTSSVETDTQLLALVTSFCEQLMEKVTLRAEGLALLQPFSEARYRVEEDNFEITGFTPAARARSTALTMAFKKPEEVVGNHIAKYQAMKLSKMLMAYDFDRKLNPFAELGGFIFTFMGDGKPGTGKTTLIQMMAGLINDYCSNAGFAFRYENLSTESIDSYQGKSAQNAKAFIKTVTDPNVIGFGTIDDIDQLAGKRGDRQSSAGQLEITAVLMESFAGANTVVRGNCTFGMFSNYPENVDDALRQRAGARFLVDGPQSREDYIDILYLLMGKNHSIPVGDHDLFEAQVIQKAVAASYESHARPKEDALVRVFDRVNAEVGALDTIARLGVYLKAIQDADERFTGRAIKNITDAVKVRAMDFELPDEWMENPDLFLFKDYETKKSMIAELARPITVEMVIQEINRYADSEFRYADKSDEVAIENAVREMQRMEEAKRRYMELSRS
ncbi:energy-coupling factor transporter ATP-binding protein EcfA2 [Labrenzia sp. EL_208]|nr:energy-coupling factor transporter ATP-binding protein EcfA2 [Labrenzia sp. EL_162]MBG6178195.1 energy-coupling factor transporter ATP-binding protein EcfA2 [Labrenzia sp. EL_132]MBG6198592.1 energy-coupling factor transporter ATP-binding protein EcfA2 [Labrenzia sp. EL_159]MBG6232818.1 energy-coupling factor transporter ATP-binding protein EcfA2 [Labrenzia sp. EL_208]